MTEQIPAEAVEAAARVLNIAGWTCDHGDDEPGHYDDCDGCKRVDDGLAATALAAALPYLAQPARVVPSVEDVAEALRDEMKRYMRSPLPLADGRIGTFGATEYDLARAVLALFASQPTVEQVREQADSRG